MIACHVLVTLQTIQNFISSHREIWEYFVTVKPEISNGFPGYSSSTFLFFIDHLYVKD